ncbi:MAG: DUF3575 domain-containing protein [Bacteroides sp.]|nr:DUF3575 domain-containing protein [Bacteroides sp.]
MPDVALIIIAAASFSCSDTIADTYKIGKVDVMSDTILTKHKPFTGLKTNLIPWGAAIMNLEAEIQIGNCFSLALPVWWSPYFVSHKYALRTLAVQPEFRYWLRNPGAGHFFGMHLGIAWYNLRYRDFRYQDSGFPLFDCGVNYGYSLRLFDTLYAEFSIGAGYVITKYDRFYNIDNGAKIDTRKTSYFGIDQLGISLVYHFNL